jgi:DNA replication licensing factor MCM2
VGSNPDELVSEGANSDEEGEDLMADNWMEDYAPAPELDFYDSTMLAKDEDVQESYEMRMQYRRAAEEAMDVEDERRRRMEDEAEDVLEGANRAEAAELQDWEEDDEEDDLMDEGERSLNLEAFEGPLRQWLAEDRTRNEIKRRFRKFLLTYYDGMENAGKDPEREQRRPPIYRARIR